MRHLVLLLGLAGCALQRAAGPPSPARAFGTVVAVRALPSLAARGPVLLALGAPVADAPDTAEIVVRQDNGATVSVVQPINPGLQPGERVVVTFGAKILIARSLPPS